MKPWQDTRDVIIGAWADRPDAKQHWAARLLAVFRGLGEEPTPETDPEYWERLDREHKERIYRQPIP